MKRITITAIIALGANLAFTQMIPNGGFENWTLAGPAESVDGWAGTPGVTKSTDFHSGSFAVQVESSIFTNPITMTQDTLPGAVNTGVQGTGPGTGVRGFAFTGRPDSIIGWYKYTPVGNDLPVFNVVLSKWNTTTSSAEVISNSMFMGTAQSVYTRFSFPIEYLTTTIPDSANVELMSSNSQPNNVVLGSVLLVDDVSFVYNTPAGISTISANENGISIYPNPTSEKLFVKFATSTQSTYTVSVLDAMGRSKLEISDTDLNSGIDISSFQKGTYFIQLVDNQTKGVVNKSFIVK